MSQAPAHPQSQPTPQQPGAGAPAAASSGRPQTQGAPAQGAGPAIQRQFVSFSFHKLDPAFRRLDDPEKIQARSEFLKLLEKPRPGLMCLTYSAVGLRPECECMRWRITGSPDAFQ